MSKFICTLYGYRRTKTEKKRKERRVFHSEFLLSVPLLIDPCPVSKILPVKIPSEAHPCKDFHHFQDLVLPEELLFTVHELQ